MIDNIMQQSARIEDAYAGNIGGLKQRVEKAGVSNELLAAFVLQGQLAKQEASRRNEAMQQPTNPSTVMEQMQQAADANSGQSEGDVVERTGIAGQQMAQNAQRAQGAPQGAPQGVPQGGGGVASQVGPVKLAGGGIVAFDVGGEVTDEYLQEKGMTRAEFDSLPPQQQEQIRRLQRHSGIGAGLGGFLEDLTGMLGPGERKGGAGLDEFRRSQGFDKSTDAPAAGPSAGGITGPSVTPPASGIATVRPDLETQIAEQYKEKGVPNPKDTTLEEQGKLIKDRMAEFEETKAAAITPPVAPTGIAAYEADTELRDSAKTELGIDEEKKGLAAIERIRDLSGIEDSKQSLKDIEARAEASYKDATPSRTDNLIDLLAAGGGKGGITSLGRRSGELRREENVRRRQLDQDVSGIKVTAMKIQSQFGTDAANAYQKAETDAIRTKQNARTYLATLDKNEREDVRARMQFSLNSQKYANDLMSNEERNRILRAQLTAGNIEAMQRDVTSRSDSASTLYNDIRIQVEERPEFAALGTLDPEDDAAEIKALKAKLAAEIAITAAKVIEDMDALKRRQLEIEEQRKLFNAENTSLGADADAAIASAGT